MATTPPKPPQTEMPDEAPLKLSRTLRVADAEMDITPMIDIVFLLLIFFLVASKMDAAASVLLPPARNGQPVSEDAAIVILVRKGTGDQVVVARRDGLAFSKDPQQLEQEIGEYVEAGMTGSAPFTEPLQRIIVKAERDVKEGDVARVADAIGKAAETPMLDYAVLERQ